MVDAYHDHPRRAPRLAARLDRPDPWVAPCLKPAGPESQRKIIPSPLFGSRIDSILSSTLRMKQAEHRGSSSKPTLNQTGGLNAAVRPARTG
jgi:hypothetical protein